MALNLKNKRWIQTGNYLDLFPASGKRAFYARAVKFFLNENEWNSELRKPELDDHINMRNMLISFNDQKSSDMKNVESKDIQMQIENIKHIKKGKKRRIRKRQIKRLTHEFMLLIKHYHPMGHANRPERKERVKCMSDFRKEIAVRYFS